MHSQSRVCICRINLVGNLDLFIGTSTLRMNLSSFPRHYAPKCHLYLDCRSSFTNQVISIFLTKPYGVINLFMGHNYYSVTLFVDSISWFTRIVHLDDVSPNFSQYVSWEFTSPYNTILKIYFLVPFISSCYTSLFSMDSLASPISQKLLILIPMRSIPVCKHHLILGAKTLKGGPFLLARYCSLGCREHQ